METNKENMSQEICASWKQMLGIDKKQSFLSTNIYLYNLWNLAALVMKCFILNKNHRYPKALNVYQCHWLLTKKDAFLCSICLELFLESPSLS